MSHFMVGVIVPKNIKKVKTKVDELLAPYSEEIKVEEYDEQCSCVGYEAKKEALDKVIEQFGSINDAREKFSVEVRDPYEKKLREDDPSLTDDDMFGVLWGNDYLDNEWQKMLKPRNDLQAKIIASHPLKDSADPECDDCKGTGIYKNTYNPKSKWDWYSFGGRYNGVITGNYEGSDDGFNFDTRFRTVDKNIAKVADLIANEQEIRAIEDEKERKKADRERSRMPYAIVTPDGEWHQKGEMGWFGMDSNRKADWKDIALELLGQYKDHVIVGMDLHI